MAIPQAVQVENIFGLRFDAWFDSEETPLAAGDTIALDKNRHSSVNATGLFSLAVSETGNAGVSHKIEINVATTATLDITGLARSVRGLTSNGVLPAGLYEVIICQSVFGPKAEITTELAAAGGGTGGGEPTAGTMYYGAGTTPTTEAEILAGTALSYTDNTAVAFTLQNASGERHWYAWPTVDSLDLNNGVTQGGGEHNIDPAQVFTIGDYTGAQTDQLGATTNGVDYTFTFNQA